MKHKHLEFAIRSFFLLPIWHFLYGYQIDLSIFTGHKHKDPEWWGLTNELFAEINLIKSIASQNGDRYLV